MRINYKVVAAAFVTLYVYEVASNFRNISTAQTQLKKRSELNDFLAAKLDENRVEMTEFDRIAMGLIVS